MEIINSRIRCIRICSWPFSGGDKREIDKIEHLVNDETEKLLNLLSSYEIENYATEEFNLVSATDEGDLVDALHDLNYDFSEKLSLEKHIEIVEDHGYQVLETKDSYKDIVSQAMAHQWMELFEEMTMQQRDLYINQIRGTRWKFGTYPIVTQATRY